jgi:hypothetical protein
LVATSSPLSVVLAAKAFLSKQSTGGNLSAELDDVGSTLVRLMMGSGYRLGFKTVTAENWTTMGRHLKALAPVGTSKVGPFSVVLGVVRAS